MCVNQRFFFFLLPYRYLKPGRLAIDTSSNSISWIALDVSEIKSNCILFFFFLAPTVKLPSSDSELLESQMRLQSDRFRKELLQLVSSSGQVLCRLLGVSTRQCIRLSLLHLIGILTYAFSWLSLLPSLLDSTISKRNSSDRYLRQLSRNFGNLNQ